MVKIDQRTSQLVEISRPRCYRRMSLALLLGIGIAGFSCTDDKGGIGFEPRENGSRPIQRNRPVLPALASAETATFIDPTATITGQSTFC